ncbi:MAG: hypothetical protein IKQ27_16780 [Lachnospiraceae bacterium]|nr:hypothetical protein [Lachnospiraceae bacterium]
MKKKTVYRLLGIALSASLLLPMAGCGSEEPSGRGSITESSGKDSDNTKETTPTPTEEPIPTFVDGDGTIQANPDAENELFAELSDWSFYFSSGAGGWGTSLYFDEDGTFHGDYHDSEMGSTGPGYDYGTVYTCVFEGKCDDYEEVSKGIYRLHITDLKYDPEDVETIEDDIRYITAAPYGLENTDQLIVYMPGTPLEKMEDGYFSWVRFDQYVGPDFDWYEDYPEELPYAGIYNPADDGYGFYGYPDCTENKMCLKNMAKLPGLHNQELTINDDGTYYCEDMDDYGYIVIKNVCIPLDDTFPSAYDDLEGFVTRCIESIPGEDKPESVYAPDDEYMDFSLSYISGEPIRYAFWSTGSNEDERWCGGVFHYSYIYDENGNSSNGYAQIYMFKVDSDGDIVSNEFMDEYLHSLAYSGSFEGLSSESSESADHWIPVEVSGGDGKGGILADEVVWISGDDIETLEEYGIDPDDVCNDYAIGGADGDFQSYKLSRDCPIYFRFTDNIFERYQSYDQFCETMDGYSDGRLFYLLLDKNDKVVAMYEPYTP